MAFAVHNLALYEAYDKRHSGENIIFICWPLHRMTYKANSYRHSDDTIVKRQ